MSAATSTAAGRDVGAVRAAYARFLSAGPPGRILLTGHSHQAWPDVVRDALLSFFDDSARWVDDKWSEAIFPKADRVGSAILERMGFDGGDDIAFGRSTHELVGRLLSCLPLPAGHGSSAARPRVVTTSGEFHSLHRQLSRLGEDRIEVVWVAAEPRAGLAERLLEALTPGTAMLAVSAVLFEDAFIVPRLGEVLARAVELDAITLVDAYHAFNVAPVAWGPAARRLFVTAGSYKYAGFGEGLCWLRIPPDCRLRPADTGWFADFDSLALPRGGEVRYGKGGARFAGSTFDASCLYRAEAGLGHWDRLGLGPAELRAISTLQTRRVIAGLDAAGAGGSLVSSRDDALRAGFVSIRTTRAGAIVERLRARGVLVDSRRDLLRIGPAPYLTDDEIDRGVGAVADELARSASG
jgi:selenocysteine lyase/cysteine desulfurase